MKHLRTLVRWFVIWVHLVSWDLFLCHLLPLSNFLLVISPSACCYDSCFHSKKAIYYKRSKFFPPWNSAKLSSLHGWGEELRVEPLPLHIQRSHLIWLGHLSRMPPGRLHCGGVPGMFHWEEAPGRPRTRWGFSAQTAAPCDPDPDHWIWTWLLVFHSQKIWNHMTTLIHHPRCVEDLILCSEGRQLLNHNQ